MGVEGQPHAPAASTPGKGPVPILQEAGWTPEPVRTGGKSRPQRDFFLIHSDFIGTIIVQKWTLQLNNVSHRNGEKIKEWNFMYSNTNVGVR